ncbi:hypothetical protein [Catelliglobosispora koreensis]|uniref:hypothetical protein n=1 Tax=Catelliglobosispora koreensis TaxID=129052 RepID=UPI0003725F4B|nr:hypothetical protein [Catelliglobosispora koreensis]
MTLVDRLIAPGATRGEIVAGFTTAAAGGLLGLAIAWRAGLSALAVAVLTVVCFDLFGGAVVNATDSAKRWYHRAGRTRVHHFAFVALHLHPFVLALVVPGFSWVAAAVTYTTVLIATVAIEFAPAALRRPVAFAVTTLGMTVVIAFLAVPAAFAWIIPVLMIKLLLAYMLPERPTPSS